MNIKNYSDCLFCHRLKGHSENIKNLLQKQSKDSLLYYETEKFLVTAELHPIVEDPYFLLIPKKHFSAFVQLDLSYEKEMCDCVKFLTNLVKKNSYVIFEHGEFSKEKKAQSVYHAHSHIILTNYNYFPYILKKTKSNNFKYKIVNFADFSTIKTIKEIVGKKSYLLFRQDNLGLIVEELDQMDIPSQIFRKWIFEYENKNGKFINWKCLDNKEKSIIKRRLLSLPQKQDDGDYKNKHIEVAIGALIFNKKGSLLLTKSPKQLNKWVIPGGHVEYGEKITDSLEREIKEEVNISINKIEFLNIKEAFVKRINKHGKIEFKHFIFHNYIVYLDRNIEKIKLDNFELVDYIWIDINKALKLNGVGEEIRELIKFYLQKKESEKNKK